jgi:hypothetical protein
MSAIPPDASAMSAVSIAPLIEKTDRMRRERDVECSVGAPSGVSSAVSTRFAYLRTVRGSLSCLLRVSVPPASALLLSTVPVDLISIV